MLHHYFTQPTKWTKKQMDWLTCGPVGRSLSKALDLHPMAGILLQSLIFFPQRCRDRLLQPPASSGVVLRSSAKRYPADGQAIPPLCTSYYSLLSVGPPHTQTSQVSHSSPSATPLLHLPQCPGCSSLGPRRRPSPRCARRGVVNKRESLEEDCTWRA